MTKRFSAVVTSYLYDQEYKPFDRSCILHRKWTSRFVFYDHFAKAIVCFWVWNATNEERWNIQIKLFIIYISSQIKHFKSIYQILFSRRYLVLKNFKSPFGFEKGARIGLMRIVNSYNECCKLHRNERSVSETVDLLFNYRCISSQCIEILVVFFFFFSSSNRFNILGSRTS